MASITLESNEGKWIIASSILASSMAFIDSTALNVVLPSLQKNLDATAADLFWILNAYLLMLASLILLGGSLGDKLGRKKIFIAGILIFIGGSIACGFASNVNLLVAFRALQGMGGALMIPGSLSIISASFDASQRGKAIGTWSAFTTIVTVGGPIIGGALADAGLWRFIFFINVPIGLASVLILWFKVPESRDEAADDTLDYRGAFAIAVGLGLLTFGFLRLPSLGFQNWQVCSSLSGGLVLLIVFVFIEKKSKHPMMPLTLFSNGTFSGANLLTFFLYGGLNGAILFLTLNLVQIQGYSQLQAGLTLLPFTILMAIIARLSGNLVDNYGPRWLLIIGPAVTSLGFLLLSFVGQTEGPSDYWRSFFPGIVCFGLGMAFTVAPLTTTVMGALPSHYSGTASGINNAITRIANVFANAIFGALAILIFSSYLEKEVSNLPLNSMVKEAVIAQASDLGNASVPTSMAVENKAVIKKIYNTGFINGYSTIMKICALLSFIGSVMAILFIKNKEVKVARQ